MNAYNNQRLQKKNTLENIEELQQISNINNNNELKL